MTWLKTFLIVVLILLTETIRNQPVINFKYNIPIMADINKYFEFLLPWEGGYVNDICDSGGATKMGVTIGTWKAMGYDKDMDGDIDEDDVKLLNSADVKQVLKKGYWDLWKADQIINQSVATMLVDWVWGSGSYGIKIPQSILGVKADGVVGNITLNAVNSHNQKELFESLKAARLHFIDRIIERNPKNAKFKKGWYNRINSIKFVA